MKAPAIPDGFHVAGGRAERIARWLEKKEATAFDRLVGDLRRKLLHRGFCRFCAREVGLAAGTLGSVCRPHGPANACPGGGRAPA